MFDYLFNRRMPPAPWWRFVGWFFRSLPLPVRRPALKFHYLIGGLFESKIIKKIFNFSLSSSLIITIVILILFNYFNRL